MKINSVYIEELFNIKQQTIYFKEPDVDYFGNLKISIIVGENGTCKTSILKFFAEALALPAASRKYRDSLNKGFNIEYKIDNDDYEIGNCINKEKPLQDTKIRIPNKYPANVIVSTTALNGKFSSKDKVGRYTEYIYSGPLKSATIDILSALRDPGLEKYVKDLISLIGCSVKYRIVMPEEEVLRNIINKKGNRLGISASDSKISDFLKRHESIGSKESDVEEKRLHRRVTIKKSSRKIIINPMDIDDLWMECIEYFNKNNINLDLRIELYNLHSDEWIDIKDMSSGEQAMFDRFFSLLLSIKNNSLVLIDEPETHLHPRWAREYIHMLTKLFSDFKAHIILATHSPFITADVPSECIVGLIKDEGTRDVKQYEVNSATLGGNPVNILDEVFRLNNYTGSFSEEIIKDIKKCLENGDSEKALKMFNDLGVTISKYALFNELKNKLLGDIQ